MSLPEAHRLPLLVPSFAGIILSPVCLNHWPPEVTGAGLGAVSPFWCLWEEFEEQELCHISVSNVFLPVTSSLPCQGETGLVTLYTCSLKTPQTQSTCSPFVW